MLFGLLNMLKPKAVTPFGTLGNVLRLEESIQMASSPFGMRRGDSHQFLTFNRKTNLGEIDFLVDKKIIGDLEIRLLKAINELIFATSIQLTDIMVSQGYDVLQKKVQQRLRFLFEKGVVHCVCFTAMDSSASFRAYSLNQHGLYILRKLGVKLHQIGYARTATTRDIKRILATNQLLTKINLELPIEYLTRQTLWCDHDDNLIVRPHAIVHTKEESFLIECIRGLNEVTEDMCEKFKRYDQVLERYQEVCVPFSKKPSLIFLTEDVTSMVRVFELTRTTNLRNQLVLYCHDSKVFQNVRDSFYSEVK